jgi:hypothetical protein
MRLLLWLLLVVGFAASAVASRPEGSLREAVLDGNGDVWTFTSANHPLYRFDGTNWNNSPFPSLYTNPLKIERLADGSIVCFSCLYADKRTIVTRHTASETKTLGTCSGDPGACVSSFADHQNRAWFTSLSRIIYRADPEHGLKEIYRIPVTQFTTDFPFLSSFNPIVYLEDGRGRIWGFSQNIANNWPSLRGLLLFAGDSPSFFTEFKTSDGEKIAGTEIIALAKTDDSHLWVAVNNHGLYRMNIDSLELERIPDPAPEAFLSIMQLISVGHDLYVIAYHNGALTALWRYQQGAWKEIIHELDWGLTLWTAHQLHGGLLFSSPIYDPWYLPQEGNPQRWKGMIGDVCLVLKNDRLFFVSGGFFVASPKELSGVKTSGRVQVFRNNPGWIQDSHGAPWMMQGESGNILCHWDDGKWMPHPIPVNEKDREKPSSAKMFGIQRFLIPDAEGRIWVFPGTRSPSLQCFNPHTHRWHNFGSFQEALTQTKDKPHFLANRHDIDPQYSPDHHQIAFFVYGSGHEISDFGGGSGIQYFDGSHWKNFSRSEIDPQCEMHGHCDTPFAKNTLSFDKHGALRVTFYTFFESRDHWFTYKLEDSGLWRFENAGDKVPGKPKPPSQPIKGCITNNPDSLVSDNHGIHWLTLDGEIYKAIEGRCVRVFTPDSLPPLKKYSLLRNVFVDTKGNILLHLCTDTLDVVRIKSLKPPPPPPHTTVTFSAAGWHGIQAKFHPHATGGILFRWKLDDGPWVQTKDSTLSWNNLSMGKHTLHVSASDHDLQSDNPPVSAPFEIAPKSLPPHTTIKATPSGWHAVQVQFDPHSPSKMEFRWQLDDGPWQTTHSSTIQLKQLHSTSHTLRVVSTDEDLQSDVHPSITSFETPVDTPRQIDRFIKRLSDPDYDRRRSAITALELQPSVSIPALQKSRATASDDLKWWIDAALQAIGFRR